MVAQLPATTHSGATTLIDCQWATGMPVRGLRMWLIAPATHFDEAFVVAAGRQRPRRQVEARDGAPRRRGCGCRPARRAVVLRTDRPQVAAEVHESVPDPVLGADRCHAVGRVFLADAAEVDFHSGPRQADRALVPFDRRPVDQRDRPRECRRVRDRRRLPPEIPDAPQDAGGDVEKAAAQLVALLRVTQECHGFAVDGHRRARPRRD